MAAITVLVEPLTDGRHVTRLSVSASELDPDPSNNETVSVDFCHSYV
jgi:hypothetical protein